MLAFVLSRRLLMPVILAGCHLALAEESTSLRGHTGLVSSIAFAPDGKSVASGGQDGLGLLARIRSQRRATGFAWRRQDDEAVGRQNG